MYIDAYRLMMTLFSLPVVAILGILGYSLGGDLGALVIAGLPFAALIKFLYFQK